MDAGSRRPWKRLAATGALALAALLFSSTALADDPATLRSEVERLRAENDSLAARSQAALLELYSLEKRLGRAEARVSALRARRAAVERDELTARRGLELARADVGEAERRLGNRLRELYMRGEVDPLAVILAAESLDDALSAFDSLNRLADQDGSILRELREARVRLQQSVRTLARRSVEVRRVVAQAEAEQARLEAVRSEQGDFLASLAAQRALNSSQIADLSAQAAEAAQHSRSRTGHRARARLRSGAAARPVRAAGRRRADGRRRGRLLRRRRDGQRPPAGLGDRRRRHTRLSVRDEDVHPRLRRRGRRGPGLGHHRQDHRHLVPDLRAGPRVGAEDAHDHRLLVARRVRIPGSSPRAEEAATSAAEDRRSGKQLEELRVLLVDDHDLFRTGLRSLLEGQGLQVVGEADNGREALRLVGELAPDVVVMDLKMPGLTGVETTRQVSSIAPLTRVVVLTISVDDDDVMDAVMAGACGYLLKDSSIDQLIAGIHAAASGESLISPQIAAKVLQRLRAQTPDNAAARTLRTELSDRELEVLRLIAIGKDNAEIARELFISPKTVKNHISNILMKLQIENRIQAAVYAVRSGIV